MGRQKVRFYPIALFSSVMGFAAVTIAVSNLESIYHMNSITSLVLLTFTTVLFLANLGILLFRLMRYPQDVQKDFNHPVKMNFFGAISISFLLLGMVCLDIFYSLSFGLWVIGAIFQISLTVIILTKMMRNQSLKIAQFTPVSFIPIVGNLVVPIAGSSHVSAHLNWVFFGVGALFSIIYMTIMFQRLFFHDALPKKLVPTLFIILAPPSVAFIAYMNITGELDVFAHILYGIALFVSLFLIVQLKRIFSMPFFISAWALLFPSGAFTVATIRLFNETGFVYYEWVQFALMFSLLLLIVYLTWNTIRLLVQGTLCLRED